MRVKKTISALIITGLATASPALLADTAKTADAKPATSQLQPLPKDQKSASDKAIADTRAEQGKKLEIINQSVFEAFEKIKEATKLLDQDKTKEAIDALQAATGKFDTALAAEPGLGMVPIDSGVAVSELLNKPEDVEKAIDNAINLLKKHKVQLAREVLSPLKDEMVTATVYLPMATYPAAIKEATKLLIDGKKQEAIAVMNEALSTLVTRASVVPLGLIRAQALLVEASKMDKEKDKDKIRDYLKSAREQLKLAALLGYTDKHADEYKDIDAQIAAIQKEISGENKVEKLYDKVKGAFRKLVGEEKSATTEK
ncbi:MAG TPA: YfdX family protein [Gammaproteobacteria bacterium]|nr:YfdX family protein [Gammaproteobacteria bacterium]